MTTQLVDPSLRADRWSRLALPLLSGAAVLAAVAVLHVRDPHASGSYGICPWLAVTGTYCPACGGLRAVHDLSHGDVGAALSSNLLVVAIVLPALVVGWLAWTRSRWPGRPLGTWVARPFPGRQTAWAAAAVVLAFWVVRNLPFGSWLAP
ncbi:MAG: DUF2752 domain-containing protein [Nocardioidaceae bacterium]